MSSFARALRLVHDDTERTILIDSAFWITIAWMLALCIYATYHYMCRARSEIEATGKQEDELPQQTIDFEEILKPTTVTVASRNMYLRRNSSYRGEVSPTHTKNQTEDGEKKSTTNDNEGVDLEMQASNSQKQDQSQQLEEEDSKIAWNGEDEGSSDLFMPEQEHVAVLRIPASVAIAKGGDDDDDNTKAPSNRYVPCLCAICLGSFRPNQQVSWSAASTATQAASSTGTDGVQPTTVPACDHAFHTSCIVDYAHTCVENGRRDGKETTMVLCPLCRGPFVAVPEKSSNDDDKEDDIGGDII